MDWDSVRVFLAVARHGSLRAAGRALGLSQPTVARRLAEFETTFGGPTLFDRLPEGAHLNAAGERLVAAAERAEQAMLTLERRRAAASPALNGTVRISAGECAAGFLARCLSGATTAPLLFVASTATFLAYANIGTRLDQPGFEVHSEGLVTLSADDVYLSEHRELGLSSYDTHTDGSGVCYSSGARPILNMRPRGNAFNYVNDTHILDWLEEQNIDYDVLTDEDIDREGARALKPYRAVITGSHPEYVSRPMLDAFQAYQNGGGRHMYLGGNGFYWRIAFHSDRIGQIEIRRGISGTRTWEGEAGENNLSFTGEPGGLWRSNGRAPQRLVGVGFDAQVFDRSTFYRRMPDSFNPRIAFAFEGIGSDDRIGDFGLRLGGAAGLEIDRADRTLGSAPNLLILATANQFGSGGLPTGDGV